MKQKYETSKIIINIANNEEIKNCYEQQIKKSKIIGQSSSIKQILKLIYQIAEVDVTVLIIGETGVGKEVVANEIVKNSNRKNCPFIKVNCAAIPDNLLESELFGYEKGAFTGAQSNGKIGMFELANSGTILLDEIGDLPLNLQSKLLRVLQQKEITRIGSTKPIKLDVRVIAATNKNLEQQVEKGLFRKDLYYRLNVVPIYIPPLRSRKEDITLLTKYFLDMYNKKYSRNKQLDIEVYKMFIQYDWPGNIRELENLIERLVVVIDDDMITKKHLISLQKVFNINYCVDWLENNELSLKEAVEMVEKKMIERALKIHGSTRKAASVLKIDQSTIVRKAKKLGINII